LRRGGRMLPGRRPVRLCRPDVCADLDRYNALTTAWLDDPAVGVARITSRFVMKPVRRFAGYPLALLGNSTRQQN
jgi:hypothetical protein